MMATVVSDAPPASKGDIIVVLGFVYAAYKTMAVWRDSGGWAYTIPISCLRFEPFDKDVEPHREAWS